MSRRPKASAARVTLLDTLYEALMSKDPDARLDELERFGFFRTYIHEIQTLVGFGDGKSHKDLWKHTRQVVCQTVPVPHLRMASLFHDTGKPFAFSRVKGKITFHGHEAMSATLFDVAARRMLMPEADRARISFIIRNLGLVEGYTLDWTDSAVRRVHKDLGEAFEDVLAVARADCTTKHLDKRAKFHGLVHDLKVRAYELARVDAIPPALPTGLGTHLMTALGLPEGRELGQVMAKLKARVEAGELPRNGPVEVYLAAVR